MDFNQHIGKYFHFSFNAAVSRSLGMTGKGKGELIIDTIIQPGVVKNNLLIPRVGMGTKNCRADQLSKWRYQ